MCIIAVQYGTGWGFLILMAKFMDNIFEFAGWSGGMTPCKWMAVRALIITPLCWFGSYPYACLVLVLNYFPKAATG